MKTLNPAGNFLHRGSTRQAKFVMNLSNAIIDKDKKIRLCIDHRPTITNKIPLAIETKVLERTINKKPPGENQEATA